MFYIFQLCLIYILFFYSKPPANTESIDKGLGSMIQLNIILNNENMTIYGIGPNKKEAKVAAAKLALKSMKKLL